jgi:integrase
MNSIEQNNSDTSFISNSAMLAQDPSYQEALPTLFELPNSIIFKRTRSLNGEEGSNRETKHICQIRAKNDFEAVQCWLDEYKKRPSTYRTYQKEVERLLLWCVYQHKKPLSGLDRADFESYFDFLSNPQPAKFWCAPSGGRGNKRGTKNWKPFVGPLGRSTKATSISIIYTLVTYLVDAYYLAYHPLRLAKNLNKKNNYSEEQKIKVQERILEPDEFGAIVDAAYGLPEISKHERDDKHRIILLTKTLYFLGLRIHELETHTWSAFRQMQGRWWFFVLGKGGKLGKIPVNSEFLEAIIQYRTYFNLPKYPVPDEQTPIIQSWHAVRSLTARHMNKLLKKVAFIAAEQFCDNPDKVSKLKKFSAHWLRHLSASMQDKVGISFKHIRANLRHENDETTRRYVHALDEERHDDIQKLKLRYKMDTPSTFL